MKHDGVLGINKEEEVGELLATQTKKRRGPVAHNT